jgi:asparagine synthase (glutamine-hydrolysing)
MCGIAGYFSPVALLNKSHLQQMLQCLQHRGPDAEGIYINQSVALGHRRLSIIDLSTQANQPMTDATGRYVLVFNGEIYNYTELAKQFGLNLKTHSDTEVALALISKFGIEAVKYFEGMFAIAVYDTVDEVLHLMRDAIGIKPLYYYFDENSLVFASELKALETVGLCTEIDKSSVFNYLYTGFVPSPQSIYSKVYKLKPGHILSISKNKYSNQPFWKLSDIVLPKEEQNNRIEVLENLLIQSVNQHLRSDVPFGVFLSGGTDSSLISALAAKQIKAIQTFSIGFAGVSNNEAIHAAAIAKHLGTKHHCLEVTYQHAIDNLIDIMSRFDEPFADSSALPTYLVSELAAKQVKVVLSGDGGDELFMGYGAYQWARRLSKPYTPYIALPIKMGLNRMPSRYKRIAKMFEFKHDFMPAHIFSQEQYLFNLNECGQLMSDFALNDKMFYYDFKETVWNRKLTAAERQSLYDLQYYLPDDLLTKVDRTSMRCSIEARVPLLDKRIVAFALNLNEDLKMDNNQMKVMLKNVLYKYVPKTLLDRPKQGFSIPLNSWLKGPLYFLVEDLLNENALKRNGIINPTPVKILISQWKSGHHYLYNRIWQLIVLQHFLNKHNR